MPKFETLRERTDEEDTEKIESVKVQLSKLFSAVRTPGKRRDFSRDGSPFVGKKFEEDLKDMIAREYSPYTIILQLRKKYGENKHFRSRNVLGYIKSEILDKIDNLKLISKLRSRYKIDRRDSHAEAQEKATNAGKAFKSEKRQIEKMIEDLYARIEIMKEENSGSHFSSVVEAMITKNYETIVDLQQKLRIVEAESNGLIIDAEEIRSEVVKFVVGSAIRNLLPLIADAKRNDAKAAFATDVQSWCNTQTKLNKLQDLKLNGRPRIIDSPVKRVRQSLLPSK